MSGESSSSKILYIEFSDELLFIAHFFSLLYFQDFFNVCYFPGFLRFPWWGFCVGVTVVTWECGAISRVMSGFSAPKASAFLGAFFPFFFGKFFNADRVDVHSIWIDFGVLVVSVVSVNRVGVVGFS